MNKPHLLFRNPGEGLVEFKPRRGFVPEIEEERVKDYKYLAGVLSKCKEIFHNDIKIRHNDRILDLPVHFDLIQIDFFGAFDQPGYEGYYNNTFGLALQHLSKFNRRGLFVIEDEDKFDYFFEQITAFKERVLNQSKIEFDGKIKFIQSFKLFSSNDMTGDISNYTNIHLYLIGKGIVESSLIHPQKTAFYEFLKMAHIEYNNYNQDVELLNISEQVFNDIVNNFDFIYASCSGSGAIIQPGRYNTPKRKFGFEISNPDEKLPVIGIVDTGISKETPLSSLLISENEDYDATKTGSFVDNANHGTGVAAFAAFGKKLIPGYKGRVKADAKLLPIKIMDSNNGSISQNNIIALIKRAYYEHKVRIFTLTIGYSNFPKKSNHEISSYSRMLDELTSKLDILIFISTTNNVFVINSASDYPCKFNNSRANIASPAESMNNITIGSIADNFINGNLKSLAPSKDFPAIYSRKFHYDFEDQDLFNRHTGNKHFRKPDILLPGGDYTEYQSYGNMDYDHGGECGLEVLSADLAERTFFAIGTSYSAPLAANVAARLIQMYPDLNMQAIKAILINSSERIKTGDVLNNFSNCIKNRIMGYGNLNQNIAQYSDEDRVTIIIQDKINPGYLKTFPLYIPRYLNSAKRKNCLLKIDATLCFKFYPKSDSQLLYCPYHVTFAIGKNLQISGYRVETAPKTDGSDQVKEVPVGYNGNSSRNIRLSNATGWVQDYYYKGKITSNVQKTSINVKRDSIIDENNCFKIAINAAFHKLLSEAEKEPYKKEIPFDLVITVKQFPIANEVLPSLYNELIMCNTLESVADADAELTN